MNNKPNAPIALFESMLESTFDLTAGLGQSLEAGQIRQQQHDDYVEQYEQLSIVAAEADAACIHFERLKAVPRPWGDGHEAAMRAAMADWQAKLVRVMTALEGIDHGIVERNSGL